MAKINTCYDRFYTEVFLDFCIHYFKHLTYNVGFSAICCNTVHNVCFNVIIMEDVIYQAFQFISHGGSPYAILVVTSCVVLIAFATIFFKNYKEYRATLSTIHQIDKKATSINIDTSPKQPPEQQKQDIGEVALKELETLSDLNTSRRKRLALLEEAVTRLLQAQDAADEEANKNAERQDISKMIKEIHKTAIKKTA